MMLSLAQMVELASSLEEHPRLVATMHLGVIADACRDLGSVFSSGVNSDSNDDDTMADDIDRDRPSVELCVRLSWSSHGRRALNGADAWKHSISGVMDALILNDSEANDEEYISALIEAHQFIVLCADLLSCTSGPTVGEIPSALITSHVILIKSYHRLRSRVLIQGSRGSSMETKLLSDLHYLGARLSLESVPSITGPADCKLQVFFHCKEEDFFLQFFEKRATLFRPPSPINWPSGSLLLDYIFESFLPGCTHVPRLRPDASCVLEALSEARREDMGLGSPLLISGDDINISIVTDGHKSASVIQEGSRSEAEVTSAQLQELFQEGRTIVVRSLGSRIKREDKSPFASAIALQHSLSRALGINASSNMYVTPPGSQGLPCHADDHDVFVAQIGGSKSWLIKEPRSQDQQLPLSYCPMPSHPPLNTSDPDVYQLILHPGDVLYLPRGVIYQARATDHVASVHVSISLEVCALKCWGGLMRTAWSLSQTGSPIIDDDICKRLDDRMDLTLGLDHRRLCPLLAADRPKASLLRSLLGSKTKDEESTVHLFLTAWESLWSRLPRLFQGSPEIEGMIVAKDQSFIRECSRHDRALAALESWKRTLGTRGEVARCYAYAMSASSI